MNKRILWIDDDYYAIQGLFRPLEKEGYKVDGALSVLDAYNKAQNWKIYDLIIVDLIFSTSEEGSMPSIVKSWENQDEYAYVGIGLVKWLLQSLHVECPVIVLSVVLDPIAEYNLKNLGLAGYIRKAGLLPTTLKDEIFKFLNK